MRINLSVTEGEHSDLLRVIEYQKRVLPGSSPGITAVAKTCMNLGLSVMLQKMQDSFPVESVQKMKRPKK